ncbi:MAG TPA: KEOPS complex subunit Pcc1 [Thermoplasmata archaeon]|nr:KEOPS complex subunit Pcc1 [Thermoplasmata archaeon]
MSDSLPGWTATVSIRAPSEEIAGWLERALAPEATREVPRARATLARPRPTVVDISITARDTGALRAALNTYLGWVHLSLATLPKAEGGKPG